MIGGRPAVAEVLAAARAPQAGGVAAWRAERMLLSLVLHTYSMRYLLPSVLLLGSAPTYLLAWTLWRVLSALLPARLYQRVDDRLYCVYQNMVLFFFENYTGVQVRRGRAVRASPAARGGACSRASTCRSSRPPAAGEVSGSLSHFGVPSGTSCPAGAECVPGAAPPPAPAGCYCLSRWLPK